MSVPLEEGLKSLFDNLTQLENVLTMKFNLDVIIDIMKKGLEEHFIAEEISISKITRKEDKIIFEFYEVETSFTYRVTMYTKEQEKAKIIDGFLFSVKGIYQLDELLAKGYLKFKSLLSTFRNCWYFKEEEDCLL